MLKASRLSNFLRFSIQSKMLLFFVILVVVSIGSGLYFSLDLFYKDKSAYIFETSLSKSEQIGQGIVEYIRYQVSDAEVLAQISKEDPHSPQLKMLMDRKKDLYQFTILQKDKDGIWRNKSEVTSTQIQDHYPEVMEAFKLGDEIGSIKWDEVRQSGLKIFYHLDFNKMPYVTLAFSNKLEAEILLLKISSKPISTLFPASDSFKSFLMDDQGRFLISQDTKLADKSLVDFVLGQNVEQGVFNLDLKSGAYLLAFHKISNINVIVLNLISQESAFLATRSLIEKSLAIGLLIVSVALAFGVLVSHSMTKPIDQLMEATNRVAAGDFVTTVNVKSSDEFLVLAQSFNSMSQEILRYTNEIKEKIRMEKELAVAQLVQSSFFPHKNVTFGKLGISGFYQSASECGGDWWGAYEINGKKIVLIGDATGHGVPAALVTATANCCAQLLEDLSLNRPELLEKPADILAIMNKVIFNLGGKILMTFFIGIIDEAKELLTYSNASHNSPLLYRFADHEATKDDISVLLEAVGNRLGHQFDSTYESSQVKFSQGDVLVLYTDGIVESENQQAKTYGERRFLKSFLKVAKSRPQEMTSKIIQEAYDYYEQVPPNDDVTLVIVKQG
jgi:sigma-B regulation protein RsbU (phosphoserine phosphatase)